MKTCSTKERCTQSISIKLQSKCELSLQDKPGYKKIKGANTWQGRCRKQNTPKENLTIEIRLQIRKNKVQTNVNSKNFCSTKEQHTQGKNNLVTKNYERQKLSRMGDQAQTKTRHTTACEAAAKR